MEKMKILPFAITDIDEKHICVTGLNENGEWIRPETLFQSDIEKKVLFAYENITEFYVKASSNDEVRVEDRDLMREKSVLIKQKLLPDEIKEIIHQNLDNSVELIFGCGRSVGLIKPKVLDITYGRNLGGTKKVRIIFTDEKGVKYNFIVAERKFKKFVLSNLNEKEQFILDEKNKILECFSQVELYFTVGLTRKVTSFPGSYNGCHPLIIGVHSFPNYEHLIRL